MTTNSSEPQVPETKRSVIQWLLDSNPSLRWQAMRDLTDASDEEITAEHAKVATVFCRLINDTEMACIKYIHIQFT
jgi:hypothetical protein